MKNTVLILSFFFLLLSCVSKKQAISNTNNSNTKYKKWMQPPFLKQGDTIAIVTPASFLKDSIYSISNALDTLKSWGLHYKIYPHAFDAYKHFAGTDSVRAVDFQAAINNPNMKAIWCARGGYGTVRILDRIDFTKLRTNPKWLIGYSDVTALHNTMHNLGLQSIHAMMPTSFKKADTTKIVAIRSLKNAFFGNKNTYKIKSSKYNKLGKVKGVVVGGNLTLLQTMLGSKTSISTDKKILFIEDIGEYQYHIDRMLYSLKRAGYFEHCKGLIIGAFTKIKKGDPPFAKNMEELILEAVSEYDFPVLFDFPAGHIANNKSLIFGKKVNMIVKKDFSLLLF